MHQLFVPRRTLVWLLSYLMLPAACGWTQEQTPKALRAPVIEVLDSYCKLQIPATAGVQVGCQGTLHRVAGGGQPIAEVVVTAVEKEYAVGKVTGGEPQQGDYAVLMLAAAAVQTAAAPGATPTNEAQPSAEPQPIDRLDEALDGRIDIEPQKGKPLRNVKLLRVIRDNETGEPKLIRVEQLDRKQWTIGVPSIARVVYRAKIIYGAPRTAEDSAAGESSPDDQPKTRRQLLAEIRAKEAAEARRKWLARLEVRGVEPWAELTAEQHVDATDELKALVKQIQGPFPEMQLHETEHFLFCTNIPPQQVGPYVLSLDAMHELLTKMYRIGPEERVWRGKALVVAFLHQQQFVMFEQQFMQHNPGPGVYGLCHQKSNGEVIMACYRGDRAADFGHMLVHETSHGFIHRYRTALRLPTWVNEGMAEWIGQALVPTSTAVRNSQQTAHLMMKQSRSMGGLMSAPAGIDAWQYGVASSLTDFLIRNNKQAYVLFIEGMKEGMDWKESLQHSYKCTPEQLVAAYGQALGVPGLQP